jgi:FMN phosphatase YigB (HAD superfamily)
MVGDSIPRDIVGAVNAGMKNVLISPNGLAPKARQNWTIGSVAEIESIL